MTSRTSGSRLPAAYWRLWTASTISNLGDGVLLVALPLLAARLTRSEISISLVAAAASLPWLILSLPIGAIIDRSDRKRILVGADTIRAIVIAVLAVLAGTGNAEIWMLWIAAVMLGVAEVFFDNASQAILPAIVPPELLERANGRRYAAELAANTFIGAPIGSLLFAAAVWLPFGVDAASFVLAVLLVLPIRGSFRAGERRSGDTKTGEGERRTQTSGTRDDAPPRPTTTLREETKAGLTWLWQFPLLRSLAVALGLSNLGFQVAQAVFVLFAQERLGISERQFGFLLALMGIGAVVGALLGERIAKVFGQSGAIYAALITWAMTLMLTGLYPVTWFVALMAAIESMAATAWNVVTVSLRQQIVPAPLFGRVNGVYRWFGWGTLPIGAALGGGIAHVGGLRAPYFVGAGFVVLAILLSLRHVNAAAISAAMAEVEQDNPGNLTPVPPSLT